jgi:hypothetical protein
MVAAARGTVEEEDEMVVGMAMAQFQTRAKGEKTMRA